MIYKAQIIRNDIDKYVQNPAARAALHHRLDKLTENRPCTVVVVMIYVILRTFMRTITCGALLK